MLLTAGAKDDGHWNGGSCNATLSGGGRGIPVGIPDAVGLSVALVLREEEPMQQGLLKPGASVAGNETGDERAVGGSCGSGAN